MRTQYSSWKAALAAAVMALVAAPAAQATVINFDGSGNHGAAKSLSDPISGFVFTTSMDVVDVSPSAPLELNLNGPAHSGDYAAANNTYVNTMSRQDGATFTFSSLWVRQWGGLQPSDFTVIGKLNGVEVGSATRFSTNNWNKLNATFGGPVDTVEFRHDSFYLIDDVLVNASPAPEPSGYALLLAGLALTAYAARRQSRRPR